MRRGGRRQNEFHTLARFDPRSIIGTEREDHPRVLATTRNSPELHRLRNIRRVTRIYSARLCPPLTRHYTTPRVRFLRSGHAIFDSARKTTCPVSPLSDELSPAHSLARARAKLTRACVSACVAAHTQRYGANI